MADETPGEASVRRDGPQVNLRESREIAAHEGTVRGPAGPRSADREVVDGAAIDPRTTYDEPAGRGASGGTGNLHRDERPPDDHPFTDSETALGGADSVQKTTWGVGHGTEPTGTQEYAPVGLRKGEGDGSVVARVATGGGVSPIAWVVGILAVLALLVYSFGLLRR